MIRPAWHSPGHNEAATSEALQSDVMRFIAILALCLVAIFALVQSLPLRPAAKPNAANPAAETLPPARISTVQPSPRTAAISAPVPVRPAVREEEPNPEDFETPAEPHSPVVQMPETSATAARPAQREIETPVTASASAADEALILRFASDTALLALVAQGRVRVYAWIRNAAWQLSSERGVLHFATGATPKRFHSMMPDTVPRSIARALESAAPTVRAGTVTWGVALPSDTEHQLERLATQHRSGTLIIDATGRVRYQQAG